MDPVLTVLDKRNSAAEHGGRENCHHNNPNAKELDVFDVPVNIVDQYRVVHHELGEYTIEPGFDEGGGDRIRAVHINTNCMVIGYL